MSNKVKVQVTCKDCGVVYEVSKSHYDTYTKAGKVFRCQQCYKKWRKNDWFNELPKDKKNAISEKRSKISKSMNTNQSDTSKADRYKRMAETRKTRTSEQKLATKLKVQATWANKTDEEKAKHSRIRSTNSHVFWDNLSDEERKKLSKKMADAQRKYFDSLSNEEKAIRAMHLRESSQDYWNNMSDEEYQQRIKEMSEMRKSEWANSSDEDLAKRVAGISEGRKQYWANLTSDQKKEIAAQHSEWWQSLTPEQYQQYCYNIAIRSNLVEHDVDTDTEREFANMLNQYHIKFRSQIYNTTKHPDFDEKFPFNKYNVTGLINPYHQWDFNINIGEFNMCIDIDGSIHYNANDSIAVGIAFNDSQRPYQTDNCNGFVIECPNDVIGLDNTVIELSSNTKMTVNTLLQLLMFFNQTEREQQYAIEQYTKSHSKD